MENKCRRCHKYGHKTAKCYTKLNLNKTITIIDESTEINIKFVITDSEPVLQVLVMKDYNLKTNRTFYKEDWQGNSEKKIIMFEGEYMLSFSFRTASNINSVSIHVTREGRFLYLQSINI